MSLIEETVFDLPTRAQVESELYQNMDGEPISDPEELQKVQKERNAKITIETANFHEGISPKNRQTMAMDTDIVNEVDEIFKKLYNAEEVQYLDVYRQKIDLASSDNYHILPEVNPSNSSSNTKSSSSDSKKSSSSSRSSRSSSSSSSRSSTSRSSTPKSKARNTTDQKHKPNVQKDKTEQKTEHKRSLKPRARSSSSRSKSSSSSSSRSSRSNTSRSSSSSSSSKSFASKGRRKESKKNYNYRDRSRSRSSEKKRVSKDGRKRDSRERKKLRN